AAAAPLLGRFARTDATLQATTIKWYFRCTVTDVFCVYRRFDAVEGDGRVRLEFVSPLDVQPGNQTGNYAKAFDHSSRMRAIRRIIEEVAGTNAAVLIRGESGVGKDLVARAIHAASTRRQDPWVKVNCAALPAELLESELFGHERGAFTGA